MPAPTPVGTPQTPPGVASQHTQHWHGSISCQESHEEPHRGITSAVPRAGDGTFPIAARRRVSTSRDPPAFPGGRRAVYPSHMKGAELTAPETGDGSWRC